jgi:hypothetical protein
VVRDDRLYSGASSRYFGNDSKLSELRKPLKFYLFIYNLEEQVTIIQTSIQYYTYFVPLDMTHLVLLS